jgi:hypothetical protein
MLSSSSSIIRNIFGKESKRFYTVIVERHSKIPPIQKNLDPRKYIIKSEHFKYKFVDCLHTRKWGNVDLILTEYIEGNLNSINT